MVDYALFISFLKKTKLYDEDGSSGPVEPWAAQRSFTTSWCQIWEIQTTKDGE